VDTIKARSKQPSTSRHQREFSLLLWLACRGCSADYPAQCRFEESVAERGHSGLGGVSAACLNGRTPLHGAPLDDSRRRATDKEVFQNILAIGWGERSTAAWAADGPIGLARFTFHVDDVVKRIAVWALEIARYELRHCF